MNQCPSAFRKLKGGNRQLLIFRIAGSLCPSLSRGAALFELLAHVPRQYSRIPLAKYRLFCPQEQLNMS